MVRTQTLFLDFAKLSQVEGGEVVSNLAMVFNDLAVANSAMSRLPAGLPISLQHMRRGIEMYFSRMQSAHLYEGMKAIEQVRDTPSLKIVIGQCGAKAKKAFDTLCECLPGGKERGNFERCVGGVRNRIAFHYSMGDVSGAIERRAQIAKGKPATMTAGGDIHSVRFEFGDDLIDSIVIRRLWKIPEKADFKTEVDRTGNWCNQMCWSFMRFSSEFVPQFLRGRATV